MYNVASWLFRDEHIMLLKFFWHSFSPIILEIISLNEARYRQLNMYFLFHIKTHGSESRGQEEAGRT